MKSLKNISFNFIIIIFSMTLSASLFYQNNAKHKILCIGDSITFGALIEKNGWVDQLSRKDQKFIFINEGRKGRKTSDKNEIPPILEKNPNADLVILFLGVNDLKNGNDSLVSASTDNIKWMIHRIKEKLPSAKILLVAPCKISLTTMNEINKGKEYNNKTLISLKLLAERYKYLANAEKIDFISLFDVVSEENFVDGVHPDANGHEQIAEAIWSKIILIYS